MSCEQGRGRDSSGTWWGKDWRETDEASMCSDWQVLAGRLSPVCLPSRLCGSGSWGCSLSLFCLCLWWACPGKLGTSPPLSPRRRPGLYCLRRSSQQRLLPKNAGWGRGCGEAWAGASPPPSPPSSLFPPLSPRTAISCESL